MVATALAALLLISLAPPHLAGAGDALYAISGTVTAGVWGRAGVTVTDGEHTVITDSSGTFRFQRTLPGVVFVTAQTPRGERQTQVVILDVPGEKVVDFVMPYDVTLHGPGLWDPISTASGPVTRSLPIVTDAPDPGSPGEPGYSCVSVVDSRTGSTTAAVLEGPLPDDRWEWTATLELPELTPEGSYSIDMLVADCASGGRLTTDDSSTRRPYKIDNTPPSATDPAPTGWVAPSTIISARIVDVAGSLHPDIDDYCFRTIELYLDGARDWSACFERPDGEDRLETPVEDLAHGFHSAEIRAFDDAGNAADPLPFGFWVDARPPELVTPSPVGVISDPSPLISVGVSEPDSGVDPSSVVMRLSNGVLTSRVTATYHTASDSITYQVPDEIEGPGLGASPLPDGRYEVTVEVRDQVGHMSTLTWSFTVRTLVPDGAG